MKLVRYNQLNPAYPSAVSSMLDKFFSDSFGPVAKSFNPAVDISEDEKAYDIQLSVPGAKKENFKIELVDGTLTISGERKWEEKKEGKNYHSVESQYGSFSRSFFLPDDAQSEGIEASYEDGILKVIVPKAEKKIAKSVIEVK
ncbi:Hsp20/alpha crystallin family protein [Algoriphagus namhaensis]|uniref:Hsp20/alpha crystallin family protein n=1 Tax=Algoriphagus namhaensis TaxID=915353 RepID=A0ABV8AL56_9BACT